MITYTFIIPHKNCPDLLQRCVDSIPVREDVQIVIVDDNSDADKKPAISRNGVEVILLDAEKSNGAGRARNVGLKCAKGEWLLFSDADDYYNTDNLNSLLDRFKNDSKTDIVYLNAQSFDENGTFKNHKIDQLIKNYLDKGKYAEMYLRYTVWTPWTRMVRHALIKEHGLQYEEVPAANDKNFCLECSRFAETIAVEEKTIYNYYRPHQSSQTDKKRNSNALDSMIKVRTHSNQIYKAVGYKHMLSYFTLFHKSVYAKDIQFGLRCRKYFAVLKDNHVSLIVDLYRHYRQIVFDKTH